MNQPPDFGATTQVLQLDLRDKPRILLVDDDELILQQLEALIRIGGFEVETVPDGLEALRRLTEMFAPIVIADCRMPIIDGLALCRQIRARQWPGYVYILLLTAQDSEEDILAGLDAGADDYLSKRTSSAQLLARLRTARRILSLEHSLKQALQEKRRLSLTDPLTGVANRRYFLKRLTNELAAARDAQSGLCLLSLDIDHFKGVNDRYGHAAGDAVLQAFVQRVDRQLRPAVDWCARIGGEEFVVVLSQIDLNRACGLAEAIREATASDPVHTSAGSIPITVSIGITAWQAANKPVTAEALLQQSDRALYASKERGRNRITLSQALQGH